MTGPVAGALRPAAGRAVRRGVPRPAVRPARGATWPPTWPPCVDQDWLVPGRDGRRRARLARRAEPAWPDGLRRRAGRRSTARPCSGTFTPPRPAPPSRDQTPRRPPCAAPSAPGRSTRSPTGTSTSSRRAARLFDEVVVAVGRQRSPRTGCSTPTSGSRCCGRPCADLPNVSVEGFTGLLTTFCAERDVHAIVKGLRAVSDFDYELQMAQMNSSLTDVETVFVPTSPEWLRSWPRPWSRRSRRSAATSRPGRPTFVDTRRLADAVARGADPPSRREARARRRVTTRRGRGFAAADTGRIR